MIIPQMIQQRTSYIVGRADVDPFVRIRESVEARRNRSVCYDVSGIEWARQELVKRHLNSGSISLGERYSVGAVGHHTQTFYYFLAEV